MAGLKYFRVMPATLRGIPVEISRTGYTGDLGYEIWVASEQALALWDALVEAGRPYDITPTGMLALDVARIEAGLILLDVDYTSAKKALIPSQKYSPYEIGLGRLVSLKKAPYVGPGRASPGGAAPQPARARRPRRELGRRRAAARRGGARAADPAHGVARVGAGLPRRRPGGPRLEHHLVPHAQEDDRARDDRSRGRPAGDGAADGDDRRPQAPRRRVRRSRSFRFSIPPASAPEGLARPIRSPLTVRD